MMTEEEWLARWGPKNEALVRAIFAVKPTRRERFAAFMGSLDWMERLWFQTIIIGVPVWIVGIVAVIAS